MPDVSANQDFQQRGRDHPVVFDRADDVKAAFADLPEGYFVWVLLETGKPLLWHECFVLILFVFRLRLSELVIEILLDVVEGAGAGSASLTGFWFLR